MDGDTLATVLVAAAVGDAVAEAQDAQDSADLAVAVAQQAAVAATVDAEATAILAADLIAIKAAIVALADRQDLIAEAVAVLVDELDSAELLAESAEMVAEQALEEATIDATESELAVQEIAVTEAETNGDSGPGSDATGGESQPAGTDGGATEQPAETTPEAPKKKRREGESGKRFRFGKR